MEEREKEEKKGYIEYKQPLLAHGLPLHLNPLPQVRFLSLSSDQVERERENISWG